MLAPKSRRSAAPTFIHTARARALEACETPPPGAMGAGDMDRCVERSAHERMGEGEGGGRHGTGPV